MIAQHLLHHMLFWFPEDSGGHVGCHELCCLPGEQSKPQMLHYFPNPTVAGLWFIILIPIPPNKD